MLSLYLAMLPAEETRDKFEQLYYAYRNLMFVVAQNILDDPQLAEDAVHNAFLKIIPYFERIGDIEGHHTKSFMIIVSEGAAVNLYNQRKKDQWVSLDITDFLPGLSVEDGVDEITETNLAAEDLLQRIRQLPENYRYVLLLKYIHELDDHEIAQLLEIKPATVRQRISRAKATLYRYQQEEAEQQHA